MKTYLTLLFIVGLYACGGKQSNPDGPATVEPCSGHGIYEPAGNMQSFCTCDPGYKEFIWRRPNNTPVGFEKVGLCLPDSRSAGHGLAQPDGKHLSQSQAETLLQSGLSWTELMLPVESSNIPQGLETLGRIQLDGAGLTPESARKAVDEALRQGASQWVVLYDPILMDGTYQDVPGIKDGQKFIEWFEATHMPAVCAALDRVREWGSIPGLAAFYPGHQNIYTMGNKLVYANKSFNCSINFVEQVFTDVNPYLVETGEGSNLAELLLWNNQSYSVEFFIARIDGFLQSPFDLLTTDETGGAVAEAAIRLRSMGFDVVLLPNVEGVSLPAGTVAVTGSGELTVVGKSLQVLEKFVGPGDLNAVEPGGLYQLVSESMGNKKVRYVALTADALVPPEGADWGAFYLYDGQGEVVVRFSPYESIVEQVEELALSASGPFYVVENITEPWKPEDFRDPEVVFEEGTGTAPAWANGLGDWSQTLAGDLNADGMQDLVLMQKSEAEWVEIDEFGKPKASWQEQDLTFLVVYDYLHNPDSDWELLPQNSDIVWRIQNMCQWQAESWDGGPEIWDNSYSVGEFDGEPGDDIFVYSVVEHSLKDVRPTGYILSGKDGTVTEFTEINFMEGAVINNSDCAGSVSMAADLDEDGIDDVLLWDKYHETIYMICSDNGGGLDKSRRFESYGFMEPRIVRTTDFNGDGHIDIMVVRLSDVTFYLGNGQCELTGKREYSVGINTQWHNDFACGEFDENPGYECFFKCLWGSESAGDSEYCLASLPALSGLLSEDQWTQVLPPIETISPQAQAGDFDGDGLPEIISDNSVLRLRNGNLTLLNTYTPIPVKVLGDINGDGTDDVLTDAWTVLFGNKK
jgi:hypothetical protein